MNIGIDARLYHETGVGRYIYNLLREFLVIDNGNKYTVFTTKKAAQEMRKFNKMTVVPVSIRWHSIKEQILFSLLLNRYRFDLIHFPYFSVPVFNTHPFVVTIHDLTTLQFKTGRASTLPVPLYSLKHIGYRFILKNALYNSKTIIVPSKTVKSEVISHFPETASKIAVTYESGSLKPSSLKTTFQFEPYFLYIGNVYPHKNIENALRAVSLLNKDSSKSFKFVIVSKKDHFRESLETFVKDNNFSSFVVFKEGVSDDMLSRLYERAEALLYPSFKEGFGLPVLEALQSKCIVCCSKIPVFKELYSTIPFYFNPNSVSQIADVLKTVTKMSNEEKNQARQKGVILSRSFNWKKTAEQTLEVYSKILK